MDFTTCLIFTLISIISSSQALYNPENAPKRCQESKSYGMLGFFCNGLNLEDVPKKIRSSIEVLELSHNRIRDINSESFEPCKDVRFIYLQFNMLTSVGKGTFTQLNKLEVLDLSDNVLRDVPGEIFNLPLLRNLYLEKNNFDSHSFDNIPNPIKAPLKKLNIADNRLYTIPHQFGILPDLHHLNISTNPMRDLTPQQFSPFCNLKEVDLNNTLMERCKCLDVTDYLTAKHNVDISSFYCKVSSAECQRSSSVFNETQDYATCVSITKQVIADKEAKITWGIVGLSVLSFMIFFIGCLYCIHRRNVNQMRKRAKVNNHPVIKVFDNNPNSDDSTHSPEKLLIKKSDV